VTLVLAIVFWALALSAVYAVSLTKYRSA